ncbi:aminopeptidase [Candidatus Saganbacteria bacterium]|nr:aminopeptidase [Candidatus Saganbacteria bacterium]
MAERIGAPRLPEAPRFRLPEGIMPTLATRARGILEGTFGLQEGQRVLIVHDQGKRNIANAFANGVQILGAKVTPHELKECRFANGGGDEILALVRTGKFDVALNLFESRPDETPYRVVLTSLQKDHIAKTGHAPGITESMLMVNFDYTEASRQAQALRAAFVGAEKVHISSPMGTSIEIGIKNRKWVDDLSFDVGRFMNIPNGEIFSAPEETKANGVIVVDGSIGDFGLVPSPLRIVVRDGKVIKDKSGLVGINWFFSNVPWEHNNWLQALIEKLSVDKMASVIGELGIGLVPFELCGNLLQDEKASGTIHIAFGENTDFGGVNDSQTHRDFLVIAPTIIVYYGGNKSPFKVMGERKILV